jgi:FkbM family methyltransferase
MGTVSSVRDGHPVPVTRHFSWRWLTWLQWRLLQVAKRSGLFSNRYVPLWFPSAKLYHLGTPPSWIYKEIFVDECYAWWHATAPRTIVDAGANVGLASLYYLAKHPGVKIVAIEANPTAVEKLRGTFRGNPSVAIAPVAIAADSGRTRMWIDRASGSNLNASITGRDLEGMNGFDVIEVETMTAEAIFPEHVDLLKMDIEGAEYGVLRSPGINPARVQAIVLEAHDLDRRRAEFEELRGLLLARGYRSIDPDPAEPWPSSRIVRFDSGS